jgi:hypothetical protein
MPRSVHCLPMSGGATHCRIGPGHRHWDPVTDRPRERTTADLFCGGVVALDGGTRSATVTTRGTPPPGVGEDHQQVGGSLRKVQVTRPKDRKAVEGLLEGTARHASLDVAQRHRRASGVEGERGPGLGVKASPGRLVTAPSRSRSLSWCSHPLGRYVDSGCRHRGVCAVPPRHRFLPVELRLALPATSVPSGGG